jgi:hypothetical protein
MTNPEHCPTPLCNGTRRVVGLKHWATGDASDVAKVCITLRYYCAECGSEDVVYHGGAIDEDYAEDAELRTYWRTRNMR